MVRSHVLQGLNKKPKHRWSMLRNMTASLIIHGRIVTTHAKAKYCVPVVNKMFKMALSQKFRDANVLRGLLRNKLAYHKLYNHMLNTYRPDKGNLVRVKKVIKKRKGDKATMATLELTQNDKKVVEEYSDRKIIKHMPINFTDWEIFNLTGELKTSVVEKTQRDEIYNQLISKIKKIRDENKEENEYRKAIKKELFGSSQLYYKIKSDPMIPQQHHIHLYLNACEGETELSNFYVKTNNYLNSIIEKIKQDLNELQHIKLSPRSRIKYEIKMLNNYYPSVNKTRTDLKSQYQQYLAEKESEDNMTIQFLAEKKKLTEETKRKNVEIVKKVKDYIAMKGYDESNLSKDQVEEVNKHKFGLIKGAAREKLFPEYFSEQDRIKILAKQFKEIKNYKYDVLNDLKHFSESELVRLKYEDIRKKYATEYESFKNRQAEQKKEETKFVEKYEVITAIRKNRDRQVKKKNKPVIPHLDKYPEFKYLALPFYRKKNDLGYNLI